MTVRFTSQQDRALCAASRWLRAGGAQVFRLFGYAGTGKTTLAKHIAELAIGHVRADLVARYNKDAAWPGRCDAFTRVSDHVATVIGAREGAAVIPLRG